MTTSRLGRLLATPGANNALTPDALLDVPQRHATGDWGDLCDEDRAANDAALFDCSRLLSACALQDVKVDRGATTVLLPEEY